MYWRSWIVVVLCCVLVSESHSVENSEPRKFPDGFLFGTATSAYQIEGAWNVDGRGESMWDYFAHLNPSPINDNSTGDDATKSYYFYERDVEMLRELGVDTYRFSLSWPRILPTGFPNHINSAGVDYYNKLINELLKHNIQPIVTLYHWELPKRMHDLGGWTNAAIIDWFGDFSRIAYQLFGDRVKLWVTINEPTQICYYGYGDSILAPFLNYKGIADYMCSKYVLLAHAKAYHIYNDEFRPTQNGAAFISLSAGWFFPESEEHTEAAADAVAFDLDQYAHPIFSEEGDWPARFKNRIAEKSAEQGFARSRLPAFSPEEVEYLRGSSDFFGLNHYSSSIVYRNSSVYGLYEIPSRQDDIGAVTYKLPEWTIGESSFTKYVPLGFYKTLSYIRDTYNNPVVYVTENGFATKGGLKDDDRVQYHRGYLAAMLDAMAEGSDVRAYCAWSLMDNFEWDKGYTESMGLYEVDFDCPSRKRTPRKSAYIYKEILRTRTLDLTYEPEMAFMTIDEGH